MRTNIEPKTTIRLSHLELIFACRNGKTYIEHQYATYPLKVLRPFELGNGRVLLQLINVGPGLLAGDAYDLRIRLKPGANVVLVNQSAAKLHQMPAGTGAQQNLMLDVAENARLEVYPGLTIPFVGSEAHFETTVKLAEDARFAFLEVFAMGRVSRGEVFAFRKLSSRFKVLLAGKLVYADGLELTPENARCHGVSDGFFYVASGFWKWDTPWPLPLEKKDLQIVTGLCGPERGYLRALARDGFMLTQALRAHLQSWQVQRGVTPIPFERLML